MSFLLEELQKKGKNLRAVDTKITYVDGRQEILNQNSGNQVTIATNERTYGFVVDTKPDFVPSLIRPYLYCGSQDSAIPEILKKYDIKNVLSVGVEPISKLTDVNYHFFEVTDLPETNLTATILNCNQIIKNCIADKKSILVHCNAGVSRSVSICIGYLILEDKFTYGRALELVKNVRKCANPNTGFVAQLKQLENTS